LAGFSIFRPNNASTRDRRRFPCSGSAPRVSDHPLHKIQSRPALLRILGQELRDHKHGTFLVGTYQKVLLPLVAGTRIDDDERRLGRVGLHVLVRENADQHVADQPIKRTAVTFQFGLEAEVIRRSPVVSRLATPLASRWL